jgi:hypothetical protein
MLLAISGTFTVISPAAAHHSFSATYHQDREVTIEGTLVTFLFRNPHTVVHVMAPDDSGEMHRWAVEWAAGSALQNDGVNRESLQPGDHVIVSGNPGREQSARRMLMRAIERPSDGWTWRGRFD